MTLQSDQSLMPQQEADSALWQSRVYLRRCTPVTETLSLVGTRTHLLPEGLSLTLK